MPRLPLIELEDQPWLPASLRDYATDCLRVLFGVFADRTSLSARLEELLDADGEERIVDLCSGGAGPLFVLLARLHQRGRSPHVVLTDLYPNLGVVRSGAGGAASRVEYLDEPVDARRPPSALRGARTLFSAFHHFDPADARGILERAADERRALGIFEVAERRLATGLALLWLPFAVWAMTPFLRPFRVGRLLWTYVVPLVPLLVVWDGLASCCRSYSLDELHELTAGLERDGYRWRIGRERVAGLPVYVTYLLGLPERSEPRCESSTNASPGDLR